MNKPYHNIQGRKSGKEQGTLHHSRRPTRQSITHSNFGITNAERNLYRKVELQARANKPNTKKSEVKGIMRLLMLLKRVLGI